MGKAKKSKQKKQLISLFSGAGGMDIGFTEAGFEVAFAADYDSAAVNTYNFNAGMEVAKELNLLTIGYERFKKALFDVAGPNVSPCGIIGGPPCQGFSRGNASRSGSDPRNRLAIRYANLIIDLANDFPVQFFVFENVPDILASANAEFLERLRQRLSTKFQLFESELNAHDYHVPQTRKRYFIVGIAKGRAEVQFKFPKKATALGGTVRSAIAGLPEPKLFSRGLQASDIAFHPNHWTMQPKSSRFGKSMKSGGRSFIQLEWDKPSRTVAYGNREIHIHPNSHRRLSIYEAMKLQGFPHEYQLLGNLSQQVTQVSNAVPPPLAKAIAKSILKSL